MDCPDFWAKKCPDCPDFLGENVLICPGFKVKFCPDFLIFALKIY